ncbi:MAG: hypothetical protein V7752_08815 [Halopseudomonas sp.]
MKNENRALMLAPLITPFAFSFYAFIAGMSGFNMNEGVLTFIGLFFVICLISLPVAYLYEFFIGYRFYRLLSKKKRVNIYTLALGGVFVADIPMLLIWPMAGGGSSISFYLTFQLFSFVGFMIGLSFWVLLNLDRLRSNIKDLFKSA